MEPLEAFPIILVFMFSDGRFIVPNVLTFFKDSSESHLPKQQTIFKRKKKISVKVIAANEKFISD